MGRQWGHQIFNTTNPEAHRVLKSEMKVEQTRSPHVHPWPVGVGVFSVTWRQLADITHYHLLTASCRGNVR